MHAPNIMCYASFYFILNLVPKAQNRTLRVHLGSQANTRYRTRGTEGQRERGRERERERGRERERDGEREMERERDGERERGTERDIRL